MIVASASGPSSYRSDGRQHSTTGCVIRLPKSPIGFSSSPAADALRVRFPMLAVLIPSTVACTLKLYSTAVEQIISSRFLFIFSQCSLRQPTLPNDLKIHCLGQDRSMHSFSINLFVPIFVDPCIES